MGVTHPHGRWWVSPTLLAEAAGFTCVCPVRLCNAARNLAMARRKRPVQGLFDQPMFDRIVPAIVQMGAKIGLVADMVVPKSALP